MTGKGAFRTAVLAAASCVLLCGSSGLAAPIHPDVRKLIAEPAPATVQMVPARAGWNGSEMPRAHASNATFERLSPGNRAEEARQDLMALVLPDLRLLAAALLVILLLRRIRQARRVAPASVSAAQAQAPTAPATVATDEPGRRIA